MGKLAAVNGGVRRRLRTEKNHTAPLKNLTKAAEPATRGVDMEVPDWADSWQLWLSDPSLPAESTFSANAKGGTQRQAGREVGRQEGRKAGR